MLPQYIARRFVPSASRGISDDGPFILAIYIFSWLFDMGFFCEVELRYTSSQLQLSDILLFINLHITVLAGVCENMSSRYLCFLCGYTLSQINLKA